ncbi:hypothetical protein BDY21DRAFT_168472 [Lineolata rhizophorae]|uniref:Uncharacterized protein n=1 Tax=Lineolata rhizophorae TaxID=578093 RepID=A0A6A6P9F4_9PEZI|nr:hypothetical protein BDY21DRAFT_168472 [Lineolata rhizophorae]
MGRSSKFSFPLPARWNHASRHALDDRAQDRTHPVSSPEIRQPRPAGGTKAERLLGTSSVHVSHHPPDPFEHRPTPQHQPSHMTVAASEASFDEDPDDLDMISAAAQDLAPPASPWRDLHARPSSNALGVAAQDPDQTSLHSHVLHHNGSSSTLRSHYDPKTAEREQAKAKRKKPTGLDLSKLFPKPRTGSRNLLSPTKLVSSPSVLSFASDGPGNHAVESKSDISVDQVSSRNPSRQETLDPSGSLPRSQHQPSQRPVYDNAKTNVRRPPRGIQHWFDGIDEDDDELIEDEEPEDGTRTLATVDTSGSTASSYGPNRSMMPLPARTTSLAPSRHHEEAHARQTYLDHLSPESPSFSHNKPPSLRSAPSRMTAASVRTKESKFSNTNLQDNSVLSFSSSEDEDDEPPQGSSVAIRDSMASTVEKGYHPTSKNANAVEINPRRSSKFATSQGRSASDSAHVAEKEQSNHLDQALLAMPQPQRANIQRLRRHSQRNMSCVLELDDSPPQTSKAMSTPTLGFPGYSSDRTGDRARRTSTRRPTPPRPKTTHSDNSVGDRRSRNMFHTSTLISSNSTSPTACSFPNRPHSVAVDKSESLGPNQTPGQMPPSPYRAPSARSFSPVGVSPSPAPTPTTATSRASPLPSPITPGRSFSAGVDGDVQVVGSDADWGASGGGGGGGDVDIVSVNAEKQNNDSERGQQTRRRTASSGIEDDIRASIQSGDFSGPANHHRNSTQPKQHRAKEKTQETQKVARRPPAPIATRRKSYGRTNPGQDFNSRGSVSEDVLAAWGSLGGWSGR